jgi:putative FmdB family regulatory protein
MPIYEYTCPECGETFDKLVRSADAEIACPRCGSREVRKKVSVFASSSRGMGSGNDASAASTGCAPGGL